MKTISFIFLLSTIPLIGQAQSIQSSVISGGGGHETNVSNSASWTLGESLITTLQQGNEILTQGFQQPNYYLTDIFNVEEQQIVVSVFPNPTQGNISISFSKMTKEPYRLEIKDMQGKCLNNYELNLLENNISVEMLAKGMYIFGISSNASSSMINFKIVKN